jgi:VirE-like protein
VSEKILVSTVPSALSTETRDYEAGKLVEVIRAGGNNLHRQVEQLRETLQRELATHGDPKRAKQAAGELKKQLPAVLWSGRFTKRANDALVHHSGLLCADLDSLNGSLSEVREKLSKSPYAWALFTSPSGDGLKVVFRVYPDAEKHSGSYYAIEKHVRELTGVAVDQACKDRARLCFMSYDPAVYYNASAITIEPLPEVVKPRPSIKGMVDLSERQRIAAELLGDVDWDSETSGYVVCPGKHLHTSGDNDRDCRVDLDGGPTVHCFHNSCRGILDGVNHELRSRIGKAEYTPPESHVEQPNESAGLVGAGNGIVEPDKTIASLAALHPLDYERKREQAAK